MAFDAFGSIISTYWIFLLIALVIGIVTGWLASGASQGN